MALGIHKLDNVATVIAVCRQRCDLAINLWTPSFELQIKRFHDVNKYIATKKIESHHNINALS
jgi:hypothetical protein